MTIPVSEPVRLPEEVWRTSVALRLLRTRDLRSILNLALLHGLRPERIAIRAGLAESFVLKVMTGDAVITEPDQVQAIADALDMPLSARSVLGLSLQPCDSLVMSDEFWERPEIAQALIGWDVPAVLSAIVSERRWTQHQLAEVLGYSQSWVSNVMRGLQSLTLDQARKIVEKFGAPFHKITMRSSELSSAQQKGQAGHPAPRDSGLRASDAAEADARDVIAWIESTNISDDVIDYLAQAILVAAEDHVSLPPTAMLPRVQQLHAMVATLLQGGRQRLRQTRELLRLDAELLAYLCQLLGDVHHDQAASACGQAAVVLAGEAGASPAAAFSAQAQIARWRHRHAEAADLAAEGFRRGAPPSLRALLAYQEAAAAAAAGQERRAHAAVVRAEAVGNSEGATASIWSCPPARQALYRLAVAVNLSRPKEALKLATDAKALWQSEFPHAFGSWGHFQIAVANAHLMLGSVDGAAEQVAPVLSLPEEYRLTTLAEHLTAIDVLLRQHRFSGSASATAMRTHIAEFTRTTHRP